MNAIAGLGTLALVAVLAGIGWAWRKRSASRPLDSPLESPLDSPLGSEEPIGCRRGQFRCISR
jgi:hypothetical protein